jgi:surfactin synthase thioesterase subunit
LPDSDFLEELRQLNGTPREALEHPEFMALLLPALRADFKMNADYGYRHDAPLTCPIRAYGGCDDTWVSERGLAAWRDQTEGDFRLRLFSGDHFFLNTTRSALLQTIRDEFCTWVRHRYGNDSELDAGSPAVSGIG